MVAVLALMFALLAFCLLCLVCTAVVWLGTKSRILTRKWQVMALCPLVLAGWPAIAFWQDRVEEAACVRLRGPAELSCGAELGGVFVAMFQIGLVLAAVFIGPFLGKMLANYWLQPKGDA